MLRKVLRKVTLRPEALEQRMMLAGDVPTFDDGVFALPGPTDQLTTFEIRRTDADLASDDKTTLVGFVPDDGNGVLDSLRSTESYEVNAIARARKRVLFYGDDNSGYKLKGGVFLTFAVIKEAGVSDWLRSKTLQQTPAEIGFLYPVEEHEVGSVRALGNQAWELRWDQDGKTYTFELQLNSPELERDVLIESFIDSQSADDAPGVTVEAGDFVSRNFTVTNPGSVGLTDVVVTDDAGTPDDSSDDFHPLANVLGNGFNLGDLNANGVLDPGESWLYSSPKTASAGQFTGRTVVTALADGITLEAFDLANYFATTPDVIDIALVDVIPTPAPFVGADPGALPVYESGETYSFRPLIRNDGNVAIAGPFEVQATFRGTVSTTSANGTLQPGEELELAAIEITEAEEGTFPIEFHFDPNDLIDEVDESAASNVWATELVFAKPDVSIEEFQSTPPPLDRTEIGETPTYDIGETYQLRPVISNTGSLPVDGPLEVAVSYRDQSFLVADDRPLQCDETRTLPAIELTETEAGEYVIVFIFDPNDLVHESDESEESNTFATELRFG